MDSNDRAGVVFAQPQSLIERLAVADKCCQTLEITMPLLVDDVNDHVGHLYSGMPDRLYIIDQHGRVAYKGGRGPFGFKPGEMTQSLNMLLLDEADRAQAEVEKDKARQAQLDTRFPVMDNAVAWKHLPAVEVKSGNALPVWARMLARSLPQTTAVILEQDFAFRTSMAFDPQLRAKMRWIAADANRCEYSKAYAEADLQRAGATDVEIRAFKERTFVSSPKEQAALDFARKMTLAAYSVTDQETQELTDYFDEKTVVAMVLQMAFANFQDRLALALKVSVEEDGPLPPLDVQFVQLRPKESTIAVPRSESGKAFPKEVPTKVEDPDWHSFTFEQLQQNLTQQREREPRVSVPAWTDVAPLLPAALYPPDRPVRIKWSLATLGHQPQLTMSWLKVLRVFSREAKQDHMFEETYFWVVTRSLQCFY